MAVGAAIGRPRGTILRIRIGLGVNDIFRRCGRPMVAPTRRLEVVCHIMVLQKIGRIDYEN